MLKLLISHFQKFDWLMVIAALLLCLMGLCSLYGISAAKGEFENFTKQAVFLGIGFFLMLVLSFFNWQNLREDPYFILILYFLSLTSLAGLLLFAPSIRGVKSWYRIAGFSLDPIEVTKIILIILLAKYFSLRHVEMYRIQHIFLSGFYVLLPIILVFFQPNMGSVLVLIALWLGILFISGIKTRHFLILCLCAILLFVFGWNAFLKDYQKGRIIAFFFPQREPLGAGWSQIQSKIAIGSGGLFGKGVGKGSQTQYGFLPEPHNDFIFSVTAEEMGFAGVSVLLLLNIFLIGRILKIAASMQTNFSRILALGIALNLVIQIFINIGMNLGIMPVIGVALPFVSYGGSGLVANFAALGILQGIKANQ
ncbi:MAG: rod shape-determining protein RodA [bacterium]